MIKSVLIEQIKKIAGAFEILQSKIVFVGGAVVYCYADRPTSGIRPTDDIDVIVEVLNYNDRVELEERLWKQGFTNDIDSGVACRFLYHQIVVDIMPIHDESMNFNNAWYRYGFDHSIAFQIDDSTTIQILSAPCFLATKFEAFKDRGQSDGRTSHDFEDIVFILENRSEIWSELNAADIPLKEYLRAEFEHLLQQKYLSEWIDGHVERGTPPATGQIIENIGEFLISSLR